MVLTCAYPDCSNRLKPKRLRFPARTHPGVVTFHVFPTSEPARLKLWLLALRKDINTPMHLLKMWRLCSDHFFSDDFSFPGEDHVRLKPSAVPMVYSPPAEESQQEPYQSIKVESDEDEEAEDGLRDVLRSTPQKPKKAAVENTNALEDELHKNMTLLLRSPQWSDEHSYYALPPGRFSDEAADSEDASSDASFVPPTSTSVSRITIKTEEEEELLWTERKWIVDESALMEQFRRCQDCGAPITGKTVTSSGSLISVVWECEEGHEGHWKSSSDAHRIPSNCLLVSAGSVFTGSTYTDVSEWAAVRNI